MQAAPHRDSSRREHLRDQQLLTDEYTRLITAPLGFPDPLAEYMARRALANGWLPVANVELPAGPGNVAQGS